MLTIIWHCLFTFVCVNDLLCFFVFGFYFSKHINMLIVFIERENVDRRQFCRCIIGVSGVPRGPYCMCKTKMAACALRIKCCVLESCCSFDGSFPSRSTISSHVKITRCLHMWKDHRYYGCMINCTFHSKKLLKWNVVWYSIGVYIINRTLHGRLEIRNFSPRVEKYFTRSLRSLEEKFRTSARPCNILYVFFEAKEISIDIWATTFCKTRFFSFILGL